ncbi:hypothetical protein HYU18_01705 [Candidatus Woesearchaeota archaeon]|nr:hypothetical protein [Candidatus Woesearchaeota archaeon]
MAKGRLKLQKFVAAKKGSEAAETGLINVGQLIASAVMVLVFVVIFTVAMRLGQKEAYAQGHQESFSQLVAKLEAIDTGKIPESDHAFFISDSFYLFGFNYLDDNVKHEGGTAGKLSMIKGSPIEGCENSEACVCVCDKKDCSGFVNCNVRPDKTGKPAKISFSNIRYFAVKEDPKDIINKGEKYASGYDYLAIYGNEWRQGRVMHLKLVGSTIEVSFPSTS